ncbi:MAG: hypothetical protein ACJARX_000249 [Psychroserpens sp.]|jgi:hypothetical protein|uniref:sugar-binding protein n=1 Tax=Psychroserpens sp. TaxID=2020870 RepID=UPI0039E2E2AA
MKKTLQISNGVALVSTIVMNYLSNTGLMNDTSIGEIFGGLRTLFTTVSYAFSIWGTICLLLLGFGIYQGRSLFVKVRDDDFVLRVGGWFMLSCVANGFWIASWIYGYTGLSCFFIFSLLKIVWNNRMKLWGAPISVIAFLWWPFIIYSGWVAVTSIANVSIYLVKINWDGFGISPVTWPLVLIIIAAVINLTITCKRNMREFAFVGAWALIAIGIANQDVQITIAYTAFVTAGILIISSGIHGFKNFILEKKIMELTSLTVNGKKVKALMLLKLLSVIFISSLTSCKNIQTVNQKSSIASVSCQLDLKSTITKTMEDGFFKAHKSKSPVQIDGCNKDRIWSSVDWYDMNYLWMGNKVDTTDYKGRFKLAWDSQYLYVLVEVVDDKLNPTLENGIENYWKGDYVEVFIDEDKSGGNHKFNHQAFAYHVSTEGHVIDKNTSQETVFFDDHIDVIRSQEGDKYLWEMAIKLFDNQFDENSSKNRPVKILEQKSIGFSIAYGDNDRNDTRENFMGSKKTHGTNNDDGYVNSDVFGTVLFID